jgi:hypothetical protein
MGNRATIVIKQAHGVLGIYLHHAPAPNKYRQLIADALNAVDNAGRMEDESYATRIFVSQIIQDEWKQELSYGLTVGQTIPEVVSDDNENPVYLIELARKSVVVYTQAHRGGWHNPEVYRIGDFINLFVSAEVAN